MNILLPFDGKPHSQRAVDLAIKYFHLSKCTVTLLHVVDSPSSELVISDKTGRIEETYPQTAAEESQILLEFLAKKFEEVGAKVEIRIEHGKAGSEIKALAENTNVPVIITTPGRHSAKQLMLDSTVTNQLLQVEQEVLLILAREVKSNQLSDEDKPTCAFLLDGSEESLKCVKMLAPLIAGKMQILCVSSRLGWAHSANTNIFQVSNPAIDQTPVKEPEEILKEAVETLKSLSIEWDELIVEESFEDSLPTLEEHRSLGFLVSTRSREDVLHRPLRGAPCERLFTTVTCNSALYCAAVN
ncbi:MAG: universal stress protein [Candidatus Obscuribacterales bacterium]|nr:universal stress protein [Candidatus Obscuribacterales bacterium]